MPLSGLMMDRFNQEQFMGKRRNQPITPRREIFK